MKTIKKLLRPLVWLNKRLLAFQRKHPILDFFLEVLSHVVFIFLFGVIWFDHVEFDFDSVCSYMDSPEGEFLMFIAFASIWPVCMIFTHFFVDPRRFPEDSKEKEDSTNA